MRSGGGLSSRRFGSAFEQAFAFQCGRERIPCTRFPEGCRRIGTNKIAQVKTPWDWILTLIGISAFIDTKTTAGDSFPHSAIVPHQVNEMLKHELAGSIAGYVIHLRARDCVIFVPSRILVQRMTTRGAINASTVGVTGIGSLSTMRLSSLFQAAKEGPDGHAHD